MKTQLTRDDLRPGQRATVTELVSSAGVQAVLGMGAGKTACALTAIGELLQAGAIRTAIVMAPRTVVLDVWSREHLRWAHLRHLDVALLTGPPAQRAQRLAEAHDIYVVSIDNAVWLAETLAKDYGPKDPRWDQLVIDELSRFKSPRGVRAKKLLAAADIFKAVWGMSGTPRPNDEQDQWMQLQLISAGRAFDQSFDLWRRSNFMPMDHHGFNWKLHKFAAPGLAATVDNWSFTVPRSAESDILYNAGDGLDIYVDLPAKATRDLADLDKRLLVELGLAPDASIDAFTDADIIVALTKATAVGKMTQVLQGFIYEEGEIAVRYKQQPKLDALDAALRGLHDDPVLVPYYYREDLQALQRLIGADVPYLGHGVGDQQTRRVVDAWNAREIPVLPIHPASAGHGLNLQFGGRRLIWYNPTWSAEHYAQVIMRLARPGQTDPVFSHRIRARHWLEDLRVNRVEHKLREQADFIANMRMIA